MLNYKFISFQEIQDFSRRRPTTQRWISRGEAEIAESAVFSRNDRDAVLNMYLLIKLNLALCIL